MPHSYGYRARSRHTFSRDFRKHGNPAILSTFMPKYKMGDIVDIKANSAQQKGMPHRYYHGRTGIIFNVTKTSVGVEVNKQVREKILKKRIHVRVEHVKHSGCRISFLKRVKEISEMKSKAKAEGVRLPQSALRRVPTQPKPGRFVSPISRDGMYPLHVAPKAFDDKL